MSKPLSGKLYGSIGHLPNSRVGKHDHFITDGQAKIATVKARDKYDRVTITEKLDGSCCGVAKIDGALVPLTRSGNRCSASQYVQHHFFDHWVWANSERFYAVLNEGERLVGEWLAQAHGTRYCPVSGWEPFVAFDLMRGSRRLPYNEFNSRVSREFRVPPLLSDGPPHTVEWAQQRLSKSAYGGEYVEGYIWRVERHDEVDFLCKWVNPDYIAGKYLPEVSGGGGAAIWNWKP